MSRRPLNSRPLDSTCFIEVNDFNRYWSAVK
jgi:hypothetical protein